MTAEPLLKPQVEIPVETGHPKDVILEHENGYDGPNGTGVYSIYGLEVPFVARERSRDAVSELFTTVCELPIQFLQKNLGIAGVACLPRQKSALVLASYKHSSLNQDAIESFLLGADKLGRREIADWEVGFHVPEQPVDILLEENAPDIEQRLAHPRG